MGRDFSLYKVANGAASNTSRNLYIYIFLMAKCIRMHNAYEMRRRRTTAQRKRVGMRCIFMYVYLCMCVFLKPYGYCIQ